MAEYDETEIQELMATELIDKGHRMVVPNTESIHYEADLVSVTSSLLTNEYEIKCSRSDFRTEMRAHEKSGCAPHTKKMKHRIQQNLYDGDDKWNKDQSPNKFWLVCPAGMADEDEIPDYWGLYYVADSSVFKVKKARKIHGKKVTAELAVDLARYLTSHHWRGY